jgi:type IV secretion system protein VirB3
MNAPAQRLPVGTDLLFVGMTRPAMRFGVPYAALIVNALITLELFLLTRNLLSLLAAIPIHGLVFGLSASEPRFFELLKVWALVRVQAGAGAATPWSALTYGPFGPCSARAQVTAVILPEVASCCVP